MCLVAGKVFNSIIGSFYVVDDIIPKCCTCPMHALAVGGTGTDCMCEVSKYHGNFTQRNESGPRNESELNSVCKICPDAKTASCPPGSDKVFAYEGYLIVETTDGPTSIECQPQEACSSGTCTEHYAGEGCTRCSSDVKHYRLKTKCIECPNLSWLVILLGALGLPFVLVLFLKISQYSPNPTFGPSILLNYIQIVSIYGSLDVIWPPATESMFTAFSFANFNIDLFSPECATTADFWVKWNVKLLLPIALALIFFLLFGLLHIFSLRRLYVRFLLAPWLPKYVIRCCQKDLSSIKEKEGVNKVVTEEMLVDAEANVGNQLIYSFVSFITMSYTFLAKTSTQPFNLLEVGSSIVLRSEPSVTLQQRNMHMGLVWFFFLFYAVGIPLALFGILYWAYCKQKLHSKEFVLRFGVLFIAFRTQYWFWGPVQMLSKFITVLILDMVQDRAGDSTSAQINLMFLNLTVLMLLQEFVRPYLFTWNNRVSFVWLVASVVVVTAARFFMTSLGPKETLAYAIGVIGFVAVSMVVSVYGFRLELKRTKESSELIGDSLDAINAETSFLTTTLGIDVAESPRVHRKLMRLEPALRKRFFSSPGPLTSSLEEVELKSIENTVTHLKATISDQTSEGVF